MHVLSCPGCQTRLRFTASGQARRVRCPRCQTAFEVPAGESKPASRPSRRRPDEDAPPLAPRRKQWLVLGGAGAVLLVGVGLAAWGLRSPAPPEPEPSSSAPPPEQAVAVVPPPPEPAPAPPPPPPTAAKPPEPPKPVLPFGAPDLAEPLLTLLKQVDVPALRIGQRQAVPGKPWPTYTEKALAPYRDTYGGTPLRQAVYKARVALWAASGQEAPDGMRADVARVLKQVQSPADKQPLQAQIRAPDSAMAEKQLKDRILTKEKAIAKILGFLLETLTELEKAGEHRDAETKRWQAHYDFLLARVHAQIALLFEYQSQLGAMRRELPERDAKKHNGWRLAPREKLLGDSAGKKSAAEARKLLEKLAREHPGTPWEELARRDLATPLGLEWRGANLPGTGAKATK